MNDDVRIADEMLGDIWDIFKKIGDYGAFKSFEDLRQTTGYTHWDLKELMKKLDIPEQKYGDHKEGLSKVAYLRGRLYAMMPQYDKAIEQYEKALHLNTSDDWQALIKYYMGIAHEVREKKELAIECYEAVKNLVGLDEDIGMDSAKRIETLKAKKKSGCFIATAAYGTAECTDVMILQAFRDEVLQSSKIGAHLIQIYYSVSPTIANVISRSNAIKAMVRNLIVKPTSFFCRLFISEHELLQTKQQKKRNIKRRSKK